jgi:hypothetical protein
MKKNTKKTDDPIVYYAVAGTLFVVAGILYSKIHREEKTKRAAIKEKMNADLAAINSSAEIMKQKIQDGEYDGQSLDTMFTDFEFYRMTLHE